MNKPTVLIVEDSTTACLFMARALEKAGYLVKTAIDGREGLALVLQERPQCLILDIVLPGASGFEVCRQLRAWDPQHHLPVILVSTKNTPADRKWGLRQGADRYLPKLFTEEVLLQVVEEVLPEQVRSSTGHLRTVDQPHPEQQIQFAFHTLIPHRCQEADLMVSNNLRSVVIANKHARHLYAAIDGRRNIYELRVLTHLNMEEVSRALQLLLVQHRIQLYEPGGQPVESSLFLKDGQ